MVDFVCRLFYNKVIRYKKEGCKMKLEQIDLMKDVTIEEIDLLEKLLTKIDKSEGGKIVRDELILSEKQALSDITFSIRLLQEDIKEGRTINIFKHGKK